MEILPGIEIVDLALYLVREEALIISDVHIGYEEALNKQGMFVPRFQFSEVMKRLERILERVCPKRIFINGDIKHEFGDISDQEWRETLKIIDYLEGFGQLVLIRGNHDTILGPIAKKRELKIVDYLIIGDKMVMHGHKVVEIPKEVKTLIIGHEHPAVSLKDDVRSEIYKCYLSGKFEKRNLVVMPSFNLVTEGTDVLQEELLSPYLQQDLKNFELYIVSEGKTMHFGAMKNLK